MSAVKDFVIEPIWKRCAGVTGVLAARSTNPNDSAATGPAREASARVSPGAFMARMYSGMKRLSPGGTAPSRSRPELTRLTLRDSPARAAVPVPDSPATVASASSSRLFIGAPGVTDRQAVA